MSKLSRDTLKEIVKECLIELLSEGLTKGNVNKLSESINLSSKKNVVEKNSVNKNISKILPTKKELNNKFVENTNKIISKATNDPILAEIFADTAVTTLQEQNSADQTGKFIANSNDTYKNIVSNNNPEDIFGDASSNWAHLAFGDNK